MTFRNYRAISLSVYCLGACYFSASAASEIPPMPSEQFAVIQFTDSALDNLYGQNALDKINQLPGFTLSQSNSQRGLSAAAGNVLINGAAAVSKSESLTNILRQLPSDQIAAIHLYNSGHPFGTANQFNQLVNVITRAPKLSAHWQARSKLTSAYQAYRPSELATQISLPADVWQHQVNMHYQDDRYQSTSLYDERDEVGKTLDNGHEDFFEKLNSRQISLTSQRNLTDTRLALSIKATNDGTQIAQRRNNARQLPWEFDSYLSESEYEMSVNWQHSGQNSQWQFIALHNRNVTDANEVTYQHSATADVYQQHKVQQEQVVQFNFSAPNMHYAPEMGIEISRNQLTAITYYDGGFEQGQVTELRYQPYAAITTELSDQWQLYTRLNTERTMLSSSAQQGSKTYLGFIKPVARLSYDPQSNWDVIFTAQHHVDQLDFDDFVQSQDAEFDRTQSGNLQLRPSQYSELATQFNIRLADTLVMNFNVFHQWQKDIHEYLQLPDGDTMIGNAGHASQFGGSLSATWQTENWLEGSQLSVSYDYARAQYDDPLTGSRPVDGLTPQSAHIEFRQDMQHYSWGLDMYIPEKETNYYVDEIYIEKDQIEVNAFAEYLLFTDLRMHISVTALNTAKYSYVQNFYANNRSGSYLGTRRFDERVDPVVAVSLLGQL
ncbi:hypothetical protein [Pseudoalteromonas obscura]|uniref:TonB-dependent receptor n=1 Tax=Pseudoalteromonas obscura TaxID=3048491 RepID=A0ABT7ES22_9GAMM|nr:hypothetical protein [Pseudoalteromonas sp. P94(2023)]MDK2597770.1 hypothetical protein [Pseudoalteromonas sp. P94(2023)]